MNANTIPMEYRPKVRYWLPGAAIDEADLRQEIRAMYDRGIGGLEVVVLQSVPPDVLLSQDGWGTEQWDRVTDILNEETKRLGMSLDLAAGPGWPIASPALKDADAPGVLTELTWGCMELQGREHYEGPLPSRRTVHDEGSPTLLKILAYRQDTSDPVQVNLLGTKVKTAFGERDFRLPLIADSYTDLQGCLWGDTLTWDAPGSREDRWTVFAFWSQPAVQKINGGHTFVVDHLSREGAQAVADYWEPILSSHAFDAMESLFCDSLEYDVATDWTPNLPEEFLRRRGYDLLPYLPFIGMVNTFPAGDVPAFPSSPAKLREQVNADFSEVITQLYCEYHLSGLERMAEKYGKTIRYQVAYNKPFEEERCGLYVGIPENEALGRAQLDGQRLMAAAAHLGRKKRYSFECAAEFGQCYGQGYEDLLWWVKRSQIAGMNAQVLHGASYSGRVEGTNPESTLARNVQWPRYEGFGKFVSNNWNRTPDASHARGCMDAIARMNHVFRNQAKIDIAIFRQAYENNGNGPDFYLYPDDGELLNRGYSYEYLSDFLLRHPHAKVTERELDREGAGYRALIVPPQERMSRSAMKRIIELAENGLPVVLIGEAPQTALYYSEVRSAEDLSAWTKARDRLFCHPGIFRVQSFPQVPDALTRLGIRPRISLMSGGDVMTAFRREDAAHCIWFALYGYNRIHTGAGFVGPGDARPEDVKPVWQRPGTSSRRQVSLSLEGSGTLFRFDPWTGRYDPCSGFSEKEGNLQGTLEMEEDEMILLCLDENAAACAKKPQQSGEVHGSLALKHFAFYDFAPDTPEEISFLRSHFASVPCFSKELSGPGDLIPWAEMDEGLACRAGAGVYTGELRIDSLPPEGTRVTLSLGDVYDTFTVRINGKDAPFPDQVMKQADLTGLVHTDINEIEIRVVSELHNLLMGPYLHSLASDRTGFLSAAAASYVPRKYGLLAAEGKPIGISGK